jgi:hypothetical protein
LGSKKKTLAPAAIAGLVVKPVLSNVKPAIPPTNNVCLRALMVLS